MVAATIPKISAARNTAFPLSSPMASDARSLLRTFLIAATLVLAACTEATAPRPRFLVLDDAGTGDWQSVSVGGDHSCALKTDGRAFCWGSNRTYQLGLISSDTICGPDKGQFGCAMTPKPVQPGVRFASISVGMRHTCAITVAREAYCWGANDLGQVSEIAATGPTPVKIGGGGSALGWTQISAGYSHSCAVRTDGALFCWGANDRGQLGNGLQGSVSGLVRVQIAAPVASVSTGQQRTCARTTVGVVYCWGAVWFERSGGLEMTRSQPMPQLVPNSPAMAWLSVGSFTTCGADVSGFAYCWEGNPRGEMGNGTRTGSTSPQRVASNLEFVQVSAGIVQSCGVVTSGAGYCWGDDTFGQLGVSPTTLLERCDNQQLPCSTSPVAVFGRQQFVEISTGFGSHSCGVTVRGNLYCWGLGVSGQRGDGTASYARSAPMRVMDPR
jgi:alpha-tubulin suppressor-like RCC1 family protein